MEIEMTIAITVFVLVWVWCIWEFINAPIMPDEYNESTEEELRDE